MFCICSQQKTPDKTLPALVILLPFLFLINLLFVGSLSVSAQQAIELNSSSYPGSISNGPTTSSQTVGFRDNTTGSSFISMSNSLTVTASFSNQQYTSVPGAQAGMLFGATRNGSTNFNLIGAPVFDNLNTKGSPSNSAFTSNPYGASGTGIDGEANYGFELMNVTTMWLGTSGPSGLRAYYGDLTFTFSRPVSDPVVHLGELGGNTGTNGISTEFELPSGSSLTLTKLSGTSELTVPVTNNKILNSASAPSGGCGSGSACGSIRINGTNITSVTFKVYVRFQNTNFPVSVNTAQGDAYMISFSLATFNLSGNVYDDANGLADNTVNGLSTNAGGSLYAMAIDANNKVQGIAPVSASGTFSFKELFKGSYTTRLGANAGVLGSPPPSASLPLNWINTGENIGTGIGNDGTVDGNLSIAISTSNVDNANMGIEQVPIANDIIYTLPVLPPINSFVILNGAVGSPATGITPIRPNGTDAEDGILSAGSNLVINTLPLNGTLKYNNIPVTLGQSIVNFNPNMLAVQFTGSGYNSVGFTYSYKDAAAAASVPVTYTINFPAASLLPVTLTNFTASVQNNNSNDVLLKWQTSSEENNDGFNVQHSTDGRNWEIVGFVNGAGSSNVVISYSYLHRNISKGIHYYRLHQVDLDGNSKLSHTLLINIDGKPVVQVYPNPATDILNIIPDPQANLKEVILLDMAGRRVLSRPYLQNGYSLDISRLPAGTYLLMLQYPDEIPSYQKIIKR